MQSISPQRRRDIVDALRRGTVPSAGLGLLAVGLGRFEAAIDAELDAIEHGAGVFKAVRGEYGSGKTFFARWIQERAKKRGMASAEVQISETEQDALAEGQVSEQDTEGLLKRVGELLDTRLGGVSKSAPAFAAALRAIRGAQLHGDTQVADGLLAWIAGQPNVAASVKAKAGIKGDLDHFGALTFLHGLLVVLRDAGHKGLVLVLDEVETLQRVRTDVREKALNALRQIIDEVDSGRFPGLYVVVTGTPAFFEGPQGAQRLAPLAQRLHVDFTTEARFDNPRAVQIRLANFSHYSLVEVGTRVRDVYVQHTASADHIRAVVDDAYVADLATAVTGALGGKVGIAPRLFLKKLVADVLDRVDQFPDFDPRRDYKLTMSVQDLNPAERAATGAISPDDVRLDV
jgi:hypothetical protein